jgi:hypothetical protein
MQCLHWIDPGSAAGLLFSYFGVHAMLEYLPRIGSNQVAVISGTGAITSKLQNTQQ